MRILVAVMSNMFHNSFLQKQGNFFKLFLDTELMTKCTEVTVRGKIVLCELFSLSKGVQILECHCFAEFSFNHK